MVFKRFMGAVISTGEGLRHKKMRGFLTRWPEQNLSVSLFCDPQLCRFWLFYDAINFDGIVKGRKPDRWPVTRQLRENTLLALPIKPIVRPK